MEHQHIGRELLTKLTEQVADFAKVEVPPKSEGKQIMMVLEKVTVWIFFIVTSKLKTLLFCNPQITGE